MIICLDLGATQIKAAVVRKKEKVKFKAKNIKTQNELSKYQVQRIYKEKTKKQAAALINQLTQLILQIYLANKLNKEEKDKGKSGKVEELLIGIAAPGPLNAAQGILLEPPNLACKRLRLKQELESKVRKALNKIQEKEKGEKGVKKKRKEIRVKVIVENDANAAALAESFYWKKKNLICLTLGSGLGTGIVVEGKLLKGQAYASEFGHSTIQLNGLKDTCRNLGCIEQFVSVKGLNRLTKQYFGKPIDVKTLTDLAVHGKKAEKKKARKVFNLFAQWLGAALVNAIHIFNPELIVLNGGLSKVAWLYLNKAIAYVKAHAFRCMLKNLQIKVSRLQEKAPLLAMAWLIENEGSKK